MAICASVLGLTKVTCALLLSLYLVGKRKRMIDFL